MSDLQPERDFGIDETCEEALERMGEFGGEVHYSGGSAQPTSGHGPDLSGLTTHESQVMAEVSG